jgi:SAM-dependent methyltransferase
MTAHSAAACLADAYNEAAERYRRDDEIEVLSENHQRLGGNLRRISRSFARPIRVLDLGCGTGRYFHVLENVTRLVGVDLSARMLERAANPVRGASVTAREIQLIQGDIFQVTFPAGSFDLIYSLGLFGYGMELTTELCARIHGWLAPDGRLYFNAIEDLQRRRLDRVKKAVKRALCSRLPMGFSAKWQARDSLPVHYHARDTVESRMSRAGFVDFVLSSNPCKSPLWSGSHIECMARKPAAAVVRERGEMAGMAAA